LILVQYFSKGKEKKMEKEKELETGPTYNLGYLGDYTLNRALTTSPELVLQAAQVRVAHYKFQKLSQEYLDGAITLSELSNKIQTLILSYKSLANFPKL